MSEAISGARPPRAQAWHSIIGRAIPEVASLIRATCWSIFKRGIVGTFHKVSAKYMPLYVAEFQFRYNNRMNADIFGTAIKGC
jgi:ISXO2-like transposase domain